MSIRKQYSVEYPCCCIYIIAWLRWIKVDRSTALFEPATKESVLSSTGKDSLDLFLLNILQDADNAIKPTTRQIGWKVFIGTALLYKIILRLWKRNRLTAQKAWKKTWIKSYYYEDFIVCLDSPDSNLFTSWNFLTLLVFHQRPYFYRVLRTPTTFGTTLREVKILPT